MNKLITLFAAMISAWYGIAQTGDVYGAYFAEAYRTYPDVPAGLLEAVAYTNTRIHHLPPNTDSSCTGLPLYVGVMGLVEDGKADGSLPRDGVHCSSRRYGENSARDPRA